MISLLDLQAHKAELKQQATQAQTDGNMIKVSILAIEIKKTDKAINSWGTKQNTTYRIM